MDKSKFIDEYLEAVEKASVIPNIYCSKPYLLANENIIPYSDNSGLKGFIEKNSKIKGISFFLPPYMEENGVPYFSNLNAKVLFPSTNDEKYFRYDVQYIYERDNSLYIIERDHDVKKYFKKGYKCFSLPYNNHQYDEQLKFYHNYITTRYRDRLKIPDVELFEKMLWKDYGQHRFVLIYKDVIIGVIIWSDNRYFINIHFGLGFNYCDFNDTDDIRKKEIAFTEILIRYEFLKRFPSGVYFNDGGTGISKRAKLTKDNCHPVRIMEVQSTRRRPDMELLTGKLITEAYFKKKRTTPYNFKLFDPNFSIPLNKLKNKELRKYMKSKHKNRGKWLNSGRKSFIEMRREREAYADRKNKTT